MIGRPNSERQGDRFNRQIEASPIPRNQRLAAAVLTGLVVAAVAGVASHGAAGAGDFGYAWRAAQYLLAGKDPYAEMDPLASYSRGGPFLYPLPAAVVAAPVAAFSPGVAALLFTGVSVAVFAYAMTSKGWWGLLALLSAPAFMTVMSVNWAFLLAAAALLPGTGWLAATKPNLGLVALAYRRDRRALIGCLVFAAASLVLRPTWPFSWWTHLGKQPVAHIPMLLWPLGIIGLVGLARWRTPEGRALAAYTMVPISIIPTDHLILWLVPRTRSEMVLLTVSSWGLLPVILGFQPGARPIDPQTVRWLSTVCLVVPCSLMVWSRSNVPAKPNDEVGGSIPSLGNSITK